jgi:hypothetical protein
MAEKLAAIICLEAVNCERAGKAETSGRVSQKA